MKCETVMRFIDRYCASELPEEFMQAVDDHLAHCTCCTEALLLDEDPFLDDLLRLPWYADSPSPELTSNIMKQVNYARYSNRHWWLVAIWFCYSALWSGLGLWLILRTRAGDFLQPLQNATRTLFIALRIVVGAMGVFHINHFGVFLVFIAAAVVFSGIGLLSKEGLQ